MNPLPGWDGPVCLCDGVHRYSRTIYWIRLSIDVVGSELRGCTWGAAENFELAREDGCWKRFPIDQAWTHQGEPVLRLRDFATWDVVYQRTGEGQIVEEEIESLQDLAAYLESCFAPG